MRVFFLKPHLHYHLTDALALAKQLSHLVRLFLSTVSAVDSDAIELSSNTKDSLDQCDRVLTEDIRLFNKILTMSQSNTSLDQPGVSSIFFLPLYVDVDLGFRLLM